ncbi:sugar ABC transporter permease [Brachybacterium sp. JB7]|nr:sugar ABC transporter permease [Brachybacterium sp. JB7]RCS60630.1 sugar ABC transporter permease [Brachybacterium sp. JB7]
MIIPILTSLYYSFTSYSVLGSPTWIGLDNYQLLSQDPSFVDALIVTLIYTLGAVPLQTFLSLVIAEAVVRRFRNAFGRVVRSVLFVPVVSSLVVAAVVWRAILGTDQGLVNSFLGMLGLPGLNVLGNPNLALAAIILVTVWKNIGYFLVIYYAGILAVPAELYEASSVDGASRIQQLFKITIPSLRPITLLVVILGTIWSFQVFDLVYVMTGGGPGGATATIVVRLYQAGFENFQMGYASAMAMILFVIVVAIAIVQRKVLSDD